MVKAYLRYELSAAFGVLVSNSNIVFDGAGKLLFTAALENVAVWNVKQGTVVRTLVPQPATNGRAPAEVTRLALAPSGFQVAAGHADGTVRLWNLQTGECDVTLTGHKAAVTALRYNAGGSLLASGSQDTDIIVWDCAAEAGLFRLRGHHDQVTDVVFVERGKRLLSASKDTYVRVWELATQHCSQTVTGHAGEVWSLDVDPAEQRLVTGAADSALRLFSLAPDTDGSQTAPHEFVQPLGSLTRQSTDRVAYVRYDARGTLVACQAAGKLVELFRVRPEAEAQKHLKRRRKRRREKAHKAGGEAIEASAEQPAGAEEEGPAAVDELAPLQVIRAKAKVRAFAFQPGLPKKGGLAQIALALTNNSLELWDVSEQEVARVTVLDAAGHRSDVRAVALSSDDTLLLSTSNNSVKVWNPRTGACLRTMDAGYGLCALFAPGARHAVVGTKEGTLEVFDLGASERVEAVEAHAGAIWSLAALPDGTGFVSGSADHHLKFWQWKVVTDKESGAKRLAVKLTRALKLTDDVLCVRVTPDGKLVAAALLDATIKVFYLDSLKFFLSLYGHKLPVLSMDISSDSTLLVSGSADKNIRIWGLDFGDCHRSLFAHADSVMQVVFVRDTHYVFTVGKDKVVKYWDADKWEELLALEGHHGEVWAAAVAAGGDFLITAGHDRSLRRWDRTSEPFFVEEEREKRLDSMFEADLEDTAVERRGGDSQAKEASAAPAGRRTLEAASAADAIADALEMAAAEVQRRRDADEERRHSGAAAAAKPLAPNPLMMGMEPGAYVLKALSSIKAGELEQALLLLPFAEALRLLSYIGHWLRRGAAVELAARSATLLLRLHHAQLTATPGARAPLAALRRLLHANLQGLKDTMGFNLAALAHLQRLARQRAGLPAQPDALLPVKRKLPA